MSNINAEVGSIEDCVPFKDDNLLAATTTSDSREASAERTNIPTRRSSRMSTSDAAANGVSPLPTAATSRSYFQNKELQKTANLVPPPPDASAAKEEANVVNFTIDKIVEVVNAVLLDPSTGKVDPERLPLDPQHAINEVAANESSIFHTVSSKLENLQRMMASPTKTDWKSGRKSLAEQKPVLLLDAIVELLSLLRLTRGIWSLAEPQAQSIAGQMDAVTVAVSDLQRKLLVQIKNKRQTSSPAGSPRTDSDGMRAIPLGSIVDALSRLTSTLSEVLRSNLEVASSKLLLPRAGDPLVALIVSSEEGSSPSKGQKLRLKLQTDQAAWKDHIGPFVKTVQALSSCSLCTRLFESPELRASIGCLQDICAGLESLARQRAFEWFSIASTESLPHRGLSMPADLLVPGIKSRGPDGSRKTIAEYGRNPSIATREVQALLNVRLTELSSGFRALYRFVGSVLGGVYEDPEVLAELTDASVLGSYVTMVGFLFYHDLVDLAQWLSPMLVQIRKKLKQQTAAVNSSGTPRNQVEPLAAVSAEQLDISRAKPHSSAVNLSSLLASPTSISLTRSPESDSLLHFFLPHLRRSSRSDGSQIAAPADRINRALVWLAWEGGLVNVYDSVRQKAPEEPPTLSQSQASRSKLKLPVSQPPAEEAVENAVVTSIIEGCRVVKEKLSSALQMFSQSAEWTGRGEDIFEFCHRVNESVSLRYVGEIELRSCKDVHAKVQQPRWRSYLLGNLARYTLPPKSTQASTRLVEALPKLFGEYCHQTLFYSCPLRRGKFARPLDTTMTVASTAATASRLDGAARDLQLQLASASSFAEAAILNSHCNAKMLADVGAQVKDLQGQFQSQSQGVVDRHSNQLRNHVDRLDQQGAEIRSLQHVTSSHQTRLENQSSEMKKFGDSIAELKISTAKEVEKQLESYKQVIDDRIGAALVEIKAKEDELKNLSSGPHLQMVKELQDAARSLEERMQVQEEQAKQSSQSADEKTGMMASEVKRMNALLGSLEQQVAEETQKLEETKEKLKTTLCDFESNVKKTMQSVTESMISKSRSELSAYLTENLSQCVSNHVAYHFDRAKSQGHSSRRRLMAWASAMSGGGTPGESDKASPALIHQPLTPCRRDELGLIADSSFVMDEGETPLHGSMAWLSDVQLLNLPELNGGSKTLEACTEEVN